MYIIKGYKAKLVRCDLTTFKVEKHNSSNIGLPNAYDEQDAQHIVLKYLGDKYPHTTCESLSLDLEEYQMKQTGKNTFTLSSWGKNN